MVLLHAIVAGRPGSQDLNQGSSDQMADDTKKRQYRNMEATMGIGWLRRMLKDLTEGNWDVAGVAKLSGYLSLLAREDIEVQDCTG